MVTPSPPSLHPGGIWGTHTHLAWLSSCQGQDSNRNRPYGIQLPEPLSCEVGPCFINISLFLGNQIFRSKVNKVIGVTLGRELTLWRGSEYLSLIQSCQMTLLHGGVWRGKHPEKMFYIKAHTWTTQEWWDSF